MYSETSYHHGEAFSRYVVKGEIFNLLARDFFLYLAHALARGNHALVLKRFPLSLYFANSLANAKWRGSYVVAEKAPMQRQRGRSPVVYKLP